MFIKKLDIFGFKSFADPTEINFYEGITLVFGPNGTGKSNLVEAILWVLGEQRAGNLRVDRSDGQRGLIFHGTETRKALSVAEVALVLNNPTDSDGNRAFSYDTDEIEVRRKVYRSGESEYLINSESVRLKDIYQLFLGTGIGRSSYSVIKQGLVTDIAKKTPEERRGLIEEAAGISKYIEDRRESLKKLEDTDKNLFNVSTMIREVEKQYKTFKQQAEQTEKFHKFDDERKRARIDLSLMSIFKAKDAETKLSEELKNLEEEKTIHEKALAELDDKKRDEMSRLEETRIQVSSLDKKSVEIFHEKTAASRFVESFKSQHANTFAEIEDARKRKAKMQEKFDEHTNRLSSLETDKTNCADEIAALEANLDQNKAKIDEERQNIERCRNRIKELAFETESETEKLNETRTRVKELIDKIIEEIDKKKRDVEHLDLYQNKDKREHDIEIGFNNILESLRGKIERINEFEATGVFSGVSEERYNRLAEFVSNLRQKLSTEITNTMFLKEIFEEYNKIKDPFIDLLFNKEGTYRRKEELDAITTEIEEKLSALNEERIEIEKTITHASERIEKARQTEAELSVSLSRLRERSHALTSQINRMIEEKKEIESELEHHALRLEKLENHLKSLNSEMQRNSERLNELGEKLISIEKEKEEKNKELKKAEESIRGFESGLSQKIRKVEEISKRFVRLSERFENTKENIERIYQDFYENHSTNLKDFEKQFESEKVDEEKLKSKIRKLTEQIASLGHINEMALEEFHDAKERLEFLNKQKNDLEESKNELLKIIEECNREARVRFASTFKAINANFLNMFKTLFGGGEAKLILTEPENVLESGIDIFAQPPGKKMESIVSYSGGELTCIGLSLVFAIFEHRPSPFCILDEADAALDAANTVRFKNLLKAFSKKTQFLMITHNESAATVADTYYGITAQEHGVSNIYSIRINEDGSINNDKGVHVVDGTGKKKTFKENE